MEAPARTLTIKETAEATGLTIKAVRSRIERGTLPAVVRDGLRRIPYSELVRAGLVEADNGAAIGQLPRQGTAAESPQPDVLAELVNRLEAQAEELGRLKAITAAAETTSDQEHERAEQLETEVIELCAKVAELEAQQPRRWWRPRRRRRLVPAEIAGRLPRTFGRAVRAVRASRRVWRNGGCGPRDGSRLSYQELIAG